VAKYDWNKLKRDFLTGDHMSLKTFAEARNINYNVLRRNAKNWVEEKVTREEEKSNKILEKVTQQEIAFEINRNAAHLAAGDIIMTKLNVALQQLKIKDKNVMYLLQTAATTLEKVQRVQSLIDGSGSESAVNIIDDL